jgi:arylsulfatase A-like enzyme
LTKAAVGLKSLLLKVKESSLPSGKKIKQRTFLIGAAIVIVLGLCLGLFRFKILLPPSVKRPVNVLWIVIDTLRADHLGCYGYAPAETPKIDRLARSGVLFSQAIAPIPETGPAVSSLFTALYPVHHGHRDNVTVLDERHTTLAEILKTNGFQTAAFVEAFPFNGLHLVQGFDHYSERPRAELDGGGDNLTTKLKEPFAWLRENEEQKFFAFVHFFNPHLPYTPPLRSPRTLALNYRGLFNGDFGPVFGLWLKKIPIREQDTAFMISLYDDEISFADQAVGALLDEVKRLGLDKKTMVVLAADHGESLGEHNYYFDHGDTLYENQVRVPLIIHYPGMPNRGQTVVTQVRTIDIRPTILHLLNIPDSGKTDGVSLLPLIHGKKTSLKTRYAFSESDTIFFSNPNNRGYIEGVAGKHVAVRTNDMKLIYIPKKPESLFELYDLKDDPRELSNIIGEKKKEGDELKRVLFGWLTKIRGAPILQEGLDEETKKVLRSLNYIR